MLLAIAACLAAAPAIAAPRAFVLDPDHTHIHWEIRHFGTSTIRGRLDAIDGSITLDREARRGSAAMAIATNSVSTGVAPFDGVVRGRYVLWTAEHPTATFVAQNFVFDGERLASVTGEFTLRGVASALTLRALRFSCRAEAEPAREVCGGDFEGELQRSDFGITYGLPFVANRVRVLVQIEAVRQ